MEAVWCGDYIALYGVMGKWNSDADSMKNTEMEPK